MGQIIAADFGESNGVRTYRVNGEFSDLENLVLGIEKEGFKFSSPPIIHLSHGQCTVLLEIDILQSSEVLNNGGNNQVK